MRSMALSMLLVAALLLSAPAIALEFSVHSNTSSRLTAVLAEGEIESGDVESLKAFLDKQPRRAVTAVYLSSPGGLLYVGMELGRFFHDHAIKTIVEGGRECASACALAFLGGYDGKRPWRSSSDNSRLGFHSFRNNERPEEDQNDTQYVVSQVLAYGKQVSAPLEVLIVTFETRSDCMYWLSPEEICTLDIKLWSNTTHSWICQ